MGVRKMKKIYEIPSLKVTEIEAEDIIAVSILMGQDIINEEKTLGYGKVQVDF